jgi:putative addiction module CopG family antidote
MRSTQPMTITLPLEMAEMVKAKVASGEYATESDVVREGLRGLVLRDAAVEKWLRDDVLPTYDAMAANPGAALSADETWTQLEAHMAARTAKR